MMNPCTYVQGFFMTVHKPGSGAKKLPSESGRLPAKTAAAKNWKTGPPSAKLCQAGPISFQEPARPFPGFLFRSYISFAFLLHAHVSLSLSRFYFVLTFFKISQKSKVAK